jgi:hypothetical protein
MATTNKSFRVKSGLTVEGGALYPAAGTTTIAPIVLTSGTNLTTATAGAFEFDGTNFYLTPSSTRKTIAFTDSNITGQAGSVQYSVTFNTSGGATAGATYNGSAAKTIDYSTVGAAASSHAHGSITSDGKLGSTSGLVLVTTTAGAITTLAAGSSGQFLKHDATFGNVYLGTTTLQASSANQAVTGITSITGGTGTTNISIATAGTTGANSGNITIQSGTTTTSGATGNITVDVGSTSGGTYGTIYVGGTYAEQVEIGRSGKTTVIKGNLQIDGTTTTVNSTTLTIDDKNIVLGNDNTLDTQADGGGITLNGTTNKTFNWVDATDAWTSSEHLNLLTGKSFYINGTSVLSSSTLGSGITNSSLTKVGALSGGTAGFVKVDASGNLTSDSTTYVSAASPAFTGTVTYNSTAATITLSDSTTGTTAKTVSSIFSSTAYRAIDILVKATNSTNHEIIKALAIFDGSNVYITQYGEVYTSSNLFDIDFTYTSTNVNFVFTPVAGTTGTTSFNAVLTLLAS